MPTHSLYLTTDIPTTTPAIPNISCVGADTSIEITFSANSDGRSPITSYQYSIDNFIADINTIDINSSPYTIENLTDGNTYNVELRAVNKNGFGEKTNSPDIIPGNIPSAPTIDNIRVGNASATINFSAPLDDGGSIIQYYIISFSNDDFVTSTTIENITTNPFTISGSGLINGTTYKFKLKAHNNFGDGEFSNIVSVLMRPSATGGTIIPNVGGYKYHIFKDTGANTITFTQGGAVEYLIIAGGGAGGSSHGGGGGAGEVFQGFTNANATTSYTIDVGAGGLTNATNGGDSSAFSITCKGGGRGGGATTGLSSSGESGGGGSGYNNPIATATTAVGASQKNNASGLGNAGGLGDRTTTAGGGGGGGGAGDVGGPGGANPGNNTAVGGISGPGTNAYSVWINAIATTMNGIVTDWSLKTTGGFIASGGAGGSWAKTSVIPGSAGGGGDGGTNNAVTTPPTSGTANTGGGGGGGGSQSQSGANGGSGLVVIRYFV